MTELRSLPKALLHDHLDGGLRPATIIELAGEIGYEGLPHADEVSLASWFDQSGSGSLEGYLAAFAQTIAVMQTPSSLQRIAREAMIDLADDGVVYAEIRFAPSLHTMGGMTRDEVLEAVLSGLAAGEAETGTVGRVIVDAMRQDDDGVSVAESAARFVDRGVVGFDLAGPEAGYPSSRHRAALEAAREAGLRLTIHAGEGDGPRSVRDALDCGAERIGHGVRILEDVTVRDGEITELGEVATRVYERGVALELCPLSNVHTGAVTSLEEHPVGMLQRAGFAVTINTDNRLMSNTSMSREFEVVASHHGFELADLGAATLQAVDAAFCDETTRRRIRDVVAAGYPAS